MNLKIVRGSRAVGTLYEYEHVPYVKYNNLADQLV